MSEFDGIKGSEDDNVNDGNGFIEEEDGEDDSTYDEGAFAGEKSVEDDGICYSLYSKILNMYYVNIYLFITVLILFSLA